MKPKDAQAAVKAFEATLAPYFSALQNVDEAGVLRTHPKVLSLLSDRSDITVVRAVLSAAMGNIVSAQEIQDRVRSALEGLLGRSIGWLPPIISNTSSTEHVESRPATAAAGSTTAMEEESKQTGGKHDIDPAVREKLLANTEKVRNDYRIVDLWLLSY